MTLSPLLFLIVCPLTGLAGFVDAVAGGGGLISLPAYMIAGLPVHAAIGTNKLSSGMGTALATGRLAKGGNIPWRQAGLCIAAALVGSWAGARLALLVDPEVFKRLMLVILPAVAFIVLNRNIMRDIGKENERITGRTYLISAAAALIIGMYDGLYGPGTGTFLIIALTVFAKLALQTAQGMTKAVNLTSNVAALIIFLMNGQVVIPVAAAAALCNMAGNWCGSGMAMAKGASVVRPVMILVLILLFLKVATELFL